MLVNTKSMLRKARKEGYAVGAFNTSDLEITRAIIEAAVEAKSPVIVQTSEKAIDYAGLEQIATIMRQLAEEASVPVAVHLDHGKSFERAKDCIAHGYTSVMIDVSRLTTDQNIEICQKVVAMAHPKDVCVEAELGIISGKEDYVKALESQLTDPDEAVVFVGETGVDSLAVSIGNAHGIPAAKEIFDLDRLEAIGKKVTLPLVLHGASSTHPARIKRAIELGVAKINIDTDVRLAFNNNLRHFLVSHPDVYDPREILTEAAEGVKKIVMHKMKLFGSVGKA
jgi:fructose-bisphosphate aldolase, class II